MKLGWFFVRALPHEHGEWNSGRGTRKELEETAKKMRKKIKREKVIWDRYANAVKAGK